MSTRARRAGGGFGAVHVILFLSVAILVVVVAVPVLLILFNAFWGKGQFNRPGAAGIFRPLGRG